MQFWFQAVYVEILRGMSFWTICADLLQPPSGANDKAASAEAIDKPDSTSDTNVVAKAPKEQRAKSPDNDHARRTALEYGNARKAAKSCNRCKWLLHRKQWTEKCTYVVDGRAHTWHHSLESDPAYLR